MISVIVTTYNRPIEILKRAVLSVLNQTYKQFELLIINDAPNNKELISEIQTMISQQEDSRITYFQNEKNSGANFSRNRGIEYSNGEFIAFLDDDDEWLPTKLEKQVNLFRRDAIGLVYSKYYLRKDNENIKINPKVGYEGDCLKYLLRSNFIGSTSFPMIRRKVLGKVGGFDEKLKSCQEYDLWIRIAKDFEIVCVDEPQGYYYISDDSTFRKSDKFIAGDNMIIEKHCADFEAHVEDFQLHYLNMFFNMLREKQIAEAIKYKKLAWKTKPWSLNNISLYWILKYKL